MASLPKVHQEYYDLLKDSFTAVMGMLWEGVDDVDPMKVVIFVLVSTLTERFPNSPLTTTIPNVDSMSKEAIFAMFQEDDEFENVTSEFYRLAVDSGQRAKMDKMGEILGQLFEEVLEGKGEGTVDEEDAQRLTEVKLTSKGWKDCVPSFYLIMFRMLFQICDINNDGTIDQGELQAVTGCDATSARFVFNAMDTNGDGQIDEEELVKAAAAKGCSGCSLM